MGPGRRQTQGTSTSLFGLDLFSGAGGMSLGASHAGIQIVASVESDPAAAATYAANHPFTEVLAADIASISADTLRRFQRKRLIIFGGPPCQGFSYSNLRTRTNTNPSNWLFRQFFRVVEDLRPEWVVFENVRGLVNTAGGVFLDAVMANFRSLRYETTAGVLNAADFGVAQDRARLFVIGSRDGQKFVFPRPTCRTHVTVSQAIQDLPVLPNGAANNILPYKCSPKSSYARSLRGISRSSTGHLVTRNANYVIARYKTIPPGGNWENIPTNLMANYTDRTRCHTGIYRRLELNKPSVVIGNFRKNMLIHPTQHRGLSIREAARLQSFPDSYLFHGSIGFQQQQVGNAVPPFLAHAIFRQLMRHSS